MGLSLKITKTRTDDPDYFSVVDSRSSDSLQGKFQYSPTPIFRKLSGLQDSGMERYPSPKLAAGIHFYHLQQNKQKLFFSK